MSELYGGGGGGGGGGAATASRNGGARGVSGPVPVPHAPTSGMRTPTDIMRERNARTAAREQRKREEAERAEADRQKRFRDEELRKSAERRALAAGVGARQPTQPEYAVASPPPVPPPPTSAGNPQASADPSSQVPPNPEVRQSYRSMHGQSASQDDPRIIPQNTTGTRSSNQASNRQADPGLNPAADTPVTTQRPTQSSFPHAFERWETLSSHWEGLTSYWIRRMEQNNEEIRRDPIAQQMSRQITDLSAAGANLFHAVVELQRLRASSERKFQRWFYKTQQEQERTRDTEGKLQAALEAERAGRKEDARTRQQDDRARQLSMDAERRMNEMKRELQISKDEARRAWEELGRREQLERDRIYSLTEGHGIVIGNIQVMPQGIMSRGTSLQRSTRDAGQAYAAPATSSRAQEAPSPTETDPFSRGGPSETYTQPTTQAQSTRAATGQRYAEDDSARYVAAPPVSTTPASVGLAALAGSPGPGDSPSPAKPGEEMYMQPNVYLDPAYASQQQQRPPTAGLVSEEESDDGGYALDDQGNILRDERGNAIPFRNLAKAQLRPGQAPVASSTSSSARPAASGQTGGGSGSSRQEVGDVERERMRAAAYGRSDSTRQVPTAARGGGNQQQQHQPLPPANYEGEGWGSDDDLSPNPLHEERQMQQDLRTHHELEDQRILEEERQAMRHEDDEGDWDSSAGGAVVQRHHHPTRLSDVLEEDETSRASRQSRDSQGYNF